MELYPPHVRLALRDIHAKEQAQEPHDDGSRKKLKGPDTRYIHKEIPRMGEADRVGFLGEARIFHRRKRDGGLADWERSAYDDCEMRNEREHHRDGE